MPLISAPTPAEVLALPLLPGLAPAFAERLLTRLVRGPEARWMVWRDDRPALAGVIVDTTASAANIADLCPVAGDLALSAAELDALLAHAEATTRAGPREALEVALPPERRSWLPALEARGYGLAYAMFQMKRPPAPVVEVLPPPDLHWEFYSAARASDLHRVVGRAFAELPGAMVPELPEFARASVEADPPPEALCGPTGVAGFARVERAGAEGLVASLGRDPDARGRGLGPVLLTHALARLQALGLPSAALEVAAKNTTALQLYQRHGFQIVAQTPIYRRSVSR